MADNLETALFSSPLFLHPQMLAVFGGNTDILDISKYFTFFSPATFIILQEDVPGSDDGDLKHYYLSLALQIIVLQIIAAYFLNRKSRSYIY